MDLFLNFSHGRISGDGVDDVGGFFISGSYDDGGECRWSKTYPGSHQVSYRGFREGKGIWGLWEIANDARGGFHIWPRGTQVAGEAAEAGQKEELVEELGMGKPVVRPMPARA
jgi:hypothetical protein